MKRLMRWSMLLLLPFGMPAFATGTVHIANGDCAALGAAAAAPAGQEPALIVLARNGSYAECSIQVTGNITIDGAGAQMPLFQYQSNDGVHTSSQIQIAAGASLAIRNLNFRNPAPTNTARSGAAQPKFLLTFFPAIDNSGTLTLDSVSISGESFGHSEISEVGGGLIGNAGNLILRNTTIVNNANVQTFPLLNGSVDISQSTIANNSISSGSLFGGGTVSVANSIVINASGPICSNSVDLPVQVVSRGGNVVSDTSCGFNAPNDRVASDPRALDFGTHGGVVDTLALNYDSPAIGNGLAANCEAADARGFARGATACDSGAYEVGGGNGKLSETGMSGLYFNAANNGHYVSIQKLYGNQALVIWNTFDEHGVPAWLYGVGIINGNQIHVAQVAQNVGGTLHPGGGVSGATPTLWGSFDVNLSDCYNASLSYSSPLPQFGTGSTTLQRLVFLDGVNCAL